MYMLDEFVGMVFRWRGPGSMRRLAGSTAAVDSCFGERGGDGGPASKAGFCMPEGIDVRDGRVLIADTMADRVRMIDAGGRITTVAGRYAGTSPGPGPDFGGGFSGDGGPAFGARLSSPAAVAWLPAGGFVVADTGNGRLRHVDTRGRIRTLAKVDAPVDLAVAPNGTIYVLTRDGRVHRMAGANAVHVAGSGLPGWSGDGGDARRARLGPATDIAISRDGRTLYVADPSSHRVRAVRL
jgi:sugar lactone lactonase YvrE